MGTNIEGAGPSDLSNLWVISVSQAGAHNFQIRPVTSNCDHRSLKNSEIDHTVIISMHLN